MLAVVENLDASSCHFYTVGLSSTLSKHSHGTFVESAFRNLHFTSLLTLNYFNYVSLLEVSEHSTKRVNIAVW
jgi:hypothetical protein